MNLISNFKKIFQNFKFQYIFNNLKINEIQNNSLNFEKFINSLKIHLKSKKSNLKIILNQNKNIIKNNNKIKNEIEKKLKEKIQNISKINSFLLEKEDFKIEINFLKDKTLILEIELEKLKNQKLHLIHINENLNRDFLNLQIKKEEIKKINEEINNKKLLIYQKQLNIEKIKKSINNILNEIEFLENPIKEKINEINLIEEPSNKIRIKTNEINKKNKEFLKNNNLIQSKIIINKKIPTIDLILKKTLS